MVAGRPRTIAFSKEEMIALGQEMVEWVKKNKPIHLSMWFTQEKDFTDEQWDTFRKREEFVHYYKKALKLVGYAYLNKNSSVDSKLKDRWQRVYFKELRDQEDADAEANELRKATAALRAAEEVNEKFEPALKSLMNQIDKLQSNS